MAALRVGILGAGHAAVQHVLAARAIPGVEVCAVAARDPRRAREFASKLAIPAHFETPADLIAHPAIDAVAIALPPMLQPEAAIGAFAAGKHVLCEKPLAASVGEARRIEKAWRASGRVGMVNFCYRLIPAIREFRERVLAGECGPRSLVHVEWMLANRLDRGLTHNWKAMSHMGGGVLQSFGVHVFDYLFHGLGGTRVLAARSGILTPQRRDADGVPQMVTGEEHASVLCDSPALGTVFIHLSLVASPPVGYRATAYGSQATLQLRNPAGNPHHGPFDLSLINSEGVASSVSRQPGEVPAVAGGSLAALFVRTWRLFAEDVAAGRTESQPGIECGVRALQLTETTRDLAGMS